MQPAGLPGLGTSSGGESPLLLLSWRTLGQSPSWKSRQSLIETSGFTPVGFLRRSPPGPKLLAAVHPHLRPLGAPIVPKHCQDESQGHWRARHKGNVLVALGKARLGLNQMATTQLNTEDKSTVKTEGV